MKTLYTLLLAVFVASAATAQVGQLPLPFAESFDSNYHPNKNPTPTYMTVSLGGNSWTSSNTNPVGGIGYNLETDNGNATRDISIVVNAFEYYKVTVSWWERKSGDVAARTILYRTSSSAAYIDATPTTLGTGIAADWQKKTVELPVPANYQGYLEIQWNINRNSGPSSKSQYYLDNIEITGSQAPAIVLSEHLTQFFQAEAGFASTSRTYTLYGHFLTNNVTVTAPEHFKVSVDNINYFSSLVVNHTNGKIASPIYIKYYRPVKPENMTAIDYSYVSHPLPGEPNRLIHASGDLSNDVLQVYGEAPVPGAPLPVELASFQGQAQKGAAKLAWTTASEKNNEKFVVERSQDAKSFIAVGEVKGSGNSATKRSYSFTDNASADGINYYRLRQIDFDGTVTFSNVIALEVAGGSLGATVYPTVASAKAVTISLQNVKGNATISVVDATGRPVANFTNTTAREIELPVHNLRSGMYFVRVTDSQSQQVQRFIKK